MTHTPEDLARIKELFKRLYTAYRWKETHDAIEHPEQFKAVIGAVDSWVDELFDKFGIEKTFSLCIFTFGSDYSVMYQMIINTNNLPLDKPKQLVI